MSTHKVWLWMSIKYWLEAVKDLQELSQVYGGDGRVLAGSDAQKHFSNPTTWFPQMFPCSVTAATVAYSWLWEVSCSGCPQHWVTEMDVLKTRNARKEPKVKESITVYMYSSYNELSLCFKEFWMCIFMITQCFKWQVCSIVS